MDAAPVLPGRDNPAHIGKIRRPAMHAFAFDRRLAVFLCGALLFAAPVLAETVKGNGVVRTQARTASGFTGIALAIGARVELKQGASESVIVEADENLLPLIATKVDGGSLEIRPVRDNLNLQSNAIKVTVQARQIDALAIGGSGAILADALKAGPLKLELGGSGLIDIRRLDADRLHVAIGGSGNVKLAGTAKRASVSIGGSGNVDAPSLIAQNAQVSVAGSGDATIAVRSSLEATVAGSGNIRFRGDPSVSQTTVGSGRIQRVGALPQ
jgi:hypothetical protein